MFLSNPKTLYFSRIAQLLFGIGFLVLVCWSGTHRGWWTNINGPLAVGVIASIFTFAITLHTVITHHKNSNPFSGGSSTRTALRLLAEIIIFLLWIATAVLMLRPKSGCGYGGGDSGEWDGQPACYSDLTHAKLYSSQPLTEWDLGIAFDFVEIALFLLSAVLVFMEERGGKVQGGTSYA